MGQGWVNSRCWLVVCGWRVAATTLVARVGRCRVATTACSRVAASLVTTGRGIVSSLVGRLTLGSWILAQGSHHHLPSHASFLPAADLKSLPCLQPGDASLDESDRLVVPVSPGLAVVIKDFNLDVIVGAGSQLRLVNEKIFPVRVEIVIDGLAFPERHKCTSWLGLPGNDHIGIRLREEVKVLEVAPGQANDHTRLVLHPCQLPAEGRFKPEEGGCLLRQLTGFPLLFSQQLHCSHFNFSPQRTLLTHSRCTLLRPLDSLTGN